KYKPRRFKRFVFSSIRDDHCPQAGRSHAPLRSFLRSFVAPCNPLSPDPPFPLSRCPPFTSTAPETAADARHPLTPDEPNIESRVAFDRCADPSILVTQLACRVRNLVCRLLLEKKKDTVNR